ncbi:MBL fold metallo-hydrolase [Candidatus Parcubacteria bacterium]|nr:MAG: MBL fold metallo-hydrolase [Candidatus Parcubacteria bacterium]
MPPYQQPLPGMSVEMIDVRKGDAILVELRDGANRGLTLIVDGGCAEQGVKVLPYLQTHHAANAKVVVSTHSDNDHIGGLADIIAATRPARVYMNDPRFFQNEASIIERARRELAVEQLERLRAAFERMDGVRTAAAAIPTDVYWVFAGPNPILTWGQWNIYAVGPTTAHFDDVWFTEGTLAGLYSNDSEEAVEQTRRSGRGLIDDGTDTSGMNNTSIMLLIEGPGQKVLLTGDGGMRAIREGHAIKDLSNLTLFDVPHHGSRRNVDTAILELLRPRVAYISSPGTPKHPRRAVVRKLQHVGSVVYSTCRTQTETMYYNQNLLRPNYTTIEAWPSLGLLPLPTEQ